MVIRPKKKKSSITASTIEQPSTSTNNSVVDETMLNDFLVQNVNIPETDKVLEKDIGSEVDQSLDAGFSAVSIQPTRICVSFL